MLLSGSSFKEYFPESLANTYYRPIGEKKAIDGNVISQTKSHITVLARLGDYEHKIELYLGIITRIKDLTLRDLNISLKDRNLKELKIIKAYELFSTTTISTNYRTSIEFEKDSLEMPLLLQVHLKGQEFDFRFTKSLQHP